LLEDCEVVLLSERELLPEAVGLWVVVLLSERELLPEAVGLWEMLGEVISEGVGVSDDVGVEQSLTRPLVVADPQVYWSYTVVTHLVPFT
jgi:hypothetical protein